MLWLALLGAIVLGYSPSFFSNFYNEDYQYLSYLAQLDLAEGLGRSFVHNELDMAHVRFYRPLTSASLALDLRAFGPDPAPYLLVNLGLHLLVAASLAILLRTLVGPTGAALGAVLFATNPWSINAAGFMAARSNLLVGLFMIWSVLGHLRYRRTGHRLARWGSLLAAALALCSYEAAVVVPGLLFATELFLATPATPFLARLRSAVRQTWPAALLVVAYFGLRYWTLGVFIGAYPGRAGAVPEPLPQLARILSALVQLATPWSLELSPESRSSTTLVVGMTALAGFLWLVFRHRARASIVLFGLAWALAAAVPLYQVPDLLPLSGRRWYPASIGVAIVTGLLLRGSGRSRGVVARALLTVALLWAGASWVSLFRNADLLKTTSQRQEHVRHQILALQSTRDGQRPLFVVFRQGFESKYVNEEFQILLAESLSPPFTKEPQLVFPINTSERPSAAELKSLPGDLVFVDTDGTLRPGLPPELPTGRELSGLRLLPTLFRQRSLPLDFVQDLWLPLAPSSHRRLRMTFVTQAAIVRVEVRPIQRLPFSDLVTGQEYELIRVMDSTLLRDCVRPVVPGRPWPFFLYVEALDESGEVVARSEIERLEIIRRD